MTDREWDDEVADLADHLETQRPRPGRALRRRVAAVVSAGLRARVLRRQSVALVATGSAVLALAGIAAATAPF